MGGRGGVRSLGAGLSLAFLPPSNPSSHRRPLGSLPTDRWGSGGLSRRRRRRRMRSVRCRTPTSWGAPSSCGRDSGRGNSRILLSIHDIAIARKIRHKITIGDSKGKSSMMIKLVGMTGQCKKSDISDYLFLQPADSTPFESQTTPLLVSIRHVAMIRGDERLAFILKYGHNSPK